MKKIPHLIAVVIAFVGFFVGAQRASAQVDPLTAGSYSGVITTGTVLNGVINLKTNKAGGFTGTWISFDTTVSFKGKFSLDGTYTGVIGKGWATLSMTIAPVSGVGNFQISGTTVSGPNVGDFKLAKAVYSKAIPTSLAGAYTMLFESIAPGNNFTSPLSPPGTSYGYGSISSTGVAKVKGRFADGNGYSFSGFLVSGNKMPFMPLTKKREGICGLMAFTAASGSGTTFIPATAEGSMRFFRPAGAANDTYAAGFNQDVLTDCRAYMPGGWWFIESLGFQRKPNNVLINLSQNTISPTTSLSLYASMNEKGVISAASAVSSVVKGKVNSKTGEYSINTTYIDSTNNFRKTKLSLYGVGLQKMLGDGTAAKVQGMSIEPGLAGKSELLNNAAGTTSEILIVSPTKKEIDANGGTYRITVSASEDAKWSVDLSKLPAELYAAAPAGYAIETILSGTSSGINLPPVIDGIRYYYLFTGIAFPVYSTAGNFLYYQYLYLRRTDTPIVPMPAKRNPLESASGFDSDDDGVDDMYDSDFSWFFHSVTQRVRDNNYDGILDGVPFMITPSTEAKYDSTRYDVDDEDGDGSTFDPFFKSGILFNSKLKTYVGKGPGEFLVRVQPGAVKMAIEFPIKIGTATHMMTITPSARP